MLNDNSGGMGNIYRQSILEIFNSDKVRFYANFTKQIDDESCKECEHNNSCGNCIARIYVANIEYKKKNKDLCEIAKRTKMEKSVNLDSELK